jgi:hypothetical protein
VMTDQLAPLPEPINPLANLDRAEAEIISSAYPPRGEHPIGDAVVGAVLGGLAGAAIGRAMSRRHEETQELPEFIPGTATGHGHHHGPMSDLD